MLLQVLSGSGSPNASARTPLGTQLLRFFIYFFPLISFSHFEWSTKTGLERLSYKNSVTEVLLGLKKVVAFKNKLAIKAIRVVVRQ